MVELIGLLEFVELNNPINSINPTNPMNYENHCWYIQRPQFLSSFAKYSSCLASEDFALRARMPKRKVAMKIIGGKLRGRNFYMPNGIRPTQNIVRKALFDLLGERIKGAAFLDLFAGSGAVGLEAISRGAGKVTLVEKVPRFCAIIRENLELLQIPLLGKDRRPVYQLAEGDAFAAIKRFAGEGKAFDIIFADPAYGLGLGKKLLKTLGAYDIVNANCTVVIQHEKPEILPESQGNFFRVEQRKYGSTILSIYKCHV